MLNRYKIFYWLLKNRYYLHLFFLCIFFFKKKFILEINIKENFSHKEAKKICESLYKKKKDVYLNFIKLKKIKNHNIKNFFFKNIFISKKNKLGGGSDTGFLFNLILIFKPKKIIEFGVANGWSTLSILEACKKNKFGNLTSVDMPYYFDNAKNMIANLLKNKQFDNWQLFIEPQINYLNRLTNKKKYDFCHYDSDKSYQGRMMAYNKIWKNLNKKAIFLSDDISDNMAFLDFCKSKKKEPFVIKYKKKFLGLVIK